MTVVKRQCASASSALDARFSPTQTWIGIAKSDKPFKQRAGRCVEPCVALSNASFPRLHATRELETNLGIQAGKTGP